MVRWLGLIVGHEGPDDERGSVAAKIRSALNMEYGYFQEFPLSPTDLFTKFLKIPTKIRFYGTSDFICHRSRLVALSKIQIKS